MAFDVEYILNLRDNVSKKLTGIEAKAQKTNSTFGGLGGVIARIGGVVAFTQLAKGVINLGADMEQTRVAFGTFLGDTEKANKLIAELNQFANVTPFNNAEIIKSGRLLLAAGIQAEDMTKVLGQVGDVAAGANVPITELSAIFAKATNKGKLQAEELKALYL